MHEVKRGSQVRCLLSGVTGTVSAIVTTLSGTFRASVQPAGDGKTQPEGWDIDLNQLVWTGAGLEHLALPPRAGGGQIPVGSKVKDVISGRTGIVVSNTLFLNGCTYCGVEMPPVKDGVDLSLDFVQDLRLKVVGKGISESLPKASVEAPGGPSTRSQRAR